MALKGVDPSFGMNDFNRAKYQNESETVANAILALLFGKPGFFPSMPNLGINIQDTLYMFWDDISTTLIKAQIVTQCKELKAYVDDGSLDVIKTTYMDNPMLLIMIPVQIKTVTENLAIGIMKDENGKIRYNYVFEQTSE